MSKLQIASIVASAALFVLPIAASAATITTPLFSNGDTTIDATGGSTVSGTFVLQVGANEVCEVIRTQADPSQPVKDTSVGGQLGYQEGTYTNVPFSVTVPPNTGTYYPMVQCAGRWGGNRAVDGADNVVVGPQSLGTLRVTAGSAGTFGSGSALDQLSTLVSNLAQQVGCYSTGGTWANNACTPKAAAPAANAKCDGIKPYLSAPAGTYSATGVQLQSALLLDNPFAIPALKPGSSVPMGFRGPQTEAALSTFLSVNHCN